MAIANCKWKAARRFSTCNLRFSICILQFALRCTMGFQSKMVPEKILEVQEVTVNFGGFKALKDLNFAMERGELRVVIGPNGAGKTTLLDVVTGKVQPT